MLVVEKMLLDAFGRLRHLGGWKKQRGDHRDRTVKVDAMVNLPPSVDRSNWIGRVDDQLDIGSCTANATAGAIEFLYRKTGRIDPYFARLFIYYCSRVLVEKGSPGDDSGCQIRDAIKSVARFGVPHESLWPYDTSKFADCPPPPAFEAAKANLLLAYNLCENLNAVKQCLALGFPVVYGFSVPESFMTPGTAKTGMAMYPAPNESYVGGHAVLAYGYDDTMVMPGESTPGAILTLNSWGEGWGLGGKFMLPYRYFTTGLADDAWCIRRDGDVG